MIRPGNKPQNTTFDVLDRPLATTYPNDSTLNISRTYDQTTGHGFGVGHLTSLTDQSGSLNLTYDERGNTTNEARVITGAGTLNTTTGYDAASRVASITYPSGLIVNYARNSNGQVSAVTAKPSGASSFSNVVTSVAHLPSLSSDVASAPVSGLNFGNGLTGQYYFDPAYNEIGRLDSGSGSTPLNLGYYYNPNRSVSIAADYGSPYGVQYLGYDTLDRLTSASNNYSYGSMSWTWDATNNVTSQTLNSSTKTFSLQSGTNMLSGWTEGANTAVVSNSFSGHIATIAVNGTTTATIPYNQVSQATSATTAAGAGTYKYDYQGQRLEKIPSSGTAITYQYSRAAGELLSENGGQKADYIYLDPGVNSTPVGEVNPTTGAIYFMHVDKMGTPQKLTDSSKAVVWGAVYKPFGDTYSVTGTVVQSLRMPGQYYDAETGYNHNGFRDYAASQTRYIQHDPIDLGGGINPYQYANNNPFKYTDPKGEGPELIFPAIVGLGIVAINQLEYFAWNFKGPEVPRSVTPPPLVPVPSSRNFCTVASPRGESIAVSPTGTFVYSASPMRETEPLEEPEIDRFEEGPKIPIWQGRGMSYPAPGWR